MNAQNIWAGNDYAFIPDRGRSERFSLRAHRVRVRRLLKEQEFGKKRASTYVVVQFVNRDTGEPITYDGHSWQVERFNDEEKLYKVRAYDFVEHWDNVNDEYRYQIKKQREAEAEREERLREARVEAERREQERVARLTEVRNYLIQKGVNPEWIRNVQLDGYNGGVLLYFSRVEEAMKAEREEGNSLYDSATRSL
jgi:hypothetical protein